MPDDHVIVLRLDALAERERSRRRRGGPVRVEGWPR
jgi:hypothetical protein